MLKAVAYFSSYFYFLGIIVYLLLRRTDMRIALFLMAVALIPIGKLFYMPVPGLSSVEAAFVFAGLLALFGMILALISGIEREALLPLAFAVPPIFSLLFLPAASQKWFLSPDASTGTGEIILLRIISILIVTSYCCYCSYFIARHPQVRKSIAQYYVIGTLFATLVGTVIFYGVFVGQISEGDLEPISVGVHIVGGKIWRFNPGANVDEFGQVAGYALLLLRWTGWNRAIKFLAAALLLTAQFLTLTRATWLGLVFAYLVFALFSSARVRAAILGSAVMGIGGILILAFSFEELTPLLMGRLSLSGGVSGDDRLNSYAAAYSSLTADPFRLFFGFGWSADLYGKQSGLGTNYIHNVPIMMLFDTGVIGVLFYITLFAVVFKLLYYRLRDDFAVPASIMTFMLTLSLLHHNFYHVQTWLMMGLLMGYALANAKSPAALRDVSLAPQSPMPAPAK